MRRHLPIGFTGLILFLLGISQAGAQAACDCTSIVGSCEATATISDSFIELTSDAAECSRVDYFVNGVPLVAVVVDGEQREDRIAGDSNPEVIVQSCQVCAATMVSQDREFGGPGLYSDGDVTALIRVSPAYPAEALNNGIEGFVEIGFVVDSNGTVTMAEVLTAEPEGVFEQAALEAVSQWRFTRPTDGPQSASERLEFTIDAGLLSLRPVGARTDGPAAGSTRRNNCLQERSRYDFGPVIDISLVNACEDPLIVFSCSGGTGRLEDRWICTDPERNGTIVGSPTSDSVATVNQIEITRAADSEYWLLACSVDDNACRSDGREWVRSLHRQQVTIDPQDRTRARLARSY